MKFKKEHFFCSSRILRNVEETHEIEHCIAQIEWEEEFSYVAEGKVYKHQAAYNKALESEFVKLGWSPSPLLCESPRLIGDFLKNDVFVEVQFGNSATIYRDYYKFHYGLTKGLLSLAVLIIPTKPASFFPTRPASVGNMAEFDVAKKYFKLLPIPVPILLIGLLPER